MSTPHLRTCRLLLTLGNGRMRYCGQRRVRSNKTIRRLVRKYLDHAKIEYAPEYTQSLKMQVIYFD